MSLTTGGVDMHRLWQTASLIPAELALNPKPRELFCQDVFDNNDDNNENGKNSIRHLDNNGEPSRTDLKSRKLKSELSNW